MSISFGILWKLFVKGIYGNLQRKIVHDLLKKFKKESEKVFVRIPEIII